MENKCRFLPRPPSLLSFFLRKWGLLRGLPPPWDSFDTASHRCSLSGRRAWLGFSPSLPLVWVPYGVHNLPNSLRHPSSSLPTPSYQSRDGHFPHPLLLSTVHFLKVKESAAFCEPTLLTSFNLRATKKGRVPSCQGSTLQGRIFVTKLLAQAPVTDFVIFKHCGTLVT